MLGAIIGDIVGSRWEFNPTNDYNFEWLSSENGFTDDTICTVRTLVRASMIGADVIHIRWEVMVEDLHSGFVVIIPGLMGAMVMEQLCVRVLWHIGMSIWTRC